MTYLPLSVSVTGRRRPEPQSAGEMRWRDLCDTPAEAMTAAIDLVMPCLVRRNFQNFP